MITEIAKQQEIAKYLREKAMKQGLISFNNNKYNYTELAKKLRQYIPQNKDNDQTLVQWQKQINNIISQYFGDKTNKQSNSNNARRPTIEHAMYICQILKITLEELYTAQDKENPMEKPKTLRDLAYDGDIVQINNYSAENGGPFDYFIAYDEYSHNIYYYLVEFEQVETIKKMMKEEQHKNEFINTCKANLIRLAIKCDDAELLNQLYCWILPIKIEERLQSFNNYKDELILSEEEFKSLLSKPNIIKSLLEKQNWNSDYWFYKMGGCYAILNNKKVNIIQELKKRTQIISPNVTLLLEYAIKENNKKVFDDVVNAIVNNHKDIIALFKDEKLDLDRRFLTIDKYGQIREYPFFVYTLSKDVENMVPDDWTKLKELNESIEELRKFGIQIGGSK